jgi:hypothetical protein
MTARDLGYAARTPVSVEKTKMEIDGLLAKHGCASRGIMVDDDKGVASIGFIRGGLKYRLSVPLPTPASVKKGADLPRQWFRWDDARKSDWHKAQWEQRCRTRWRSMLLLLKAKFEAVRMGVSDVEKEFMADLVLPSGDTVLVALGKNIHEALASGHMPTLMLPESPDAH